MLRSSFPHFHIFPRKFTVAFPAARRIVDGVRAAVLTSGIRRVAPIGHWRGRFLRPARQPQLRRGTMALRAVPDHPKFAALKAALGTPKGATLGWLEALWHFTGRFTP